MGGQDLMRWRHYIIVIAIYVLFWLVGMTLGAIHSKRVRDLVNYAGRKNLPILITQGSVSYESQDFVLHSPGINSVTFMTVGKYRQGCTFGFFDETGIFHTIYHPDSPDYRTLESATFHDKYFITNPNGEMIIENFFAINYGLSDVRSWCFLRVISGWNFGVFRYGNIYTGESEEFRLSRFVTSDVSDRYSSGASWWSVVSGNGKIGLISAYFKDGGSDSEFWRLDFDTGKLTSLGIFNTATREGHNVYAHVYISFDGSVIAYEEPVNVTPGDGVASTSPPSSSSNTRKVIFIDGETGEFLHSEPSVSTPSDSQCRESVGTYVAIGHRWAGIIKPTPGSGELSSLLVLDMENNWESTLVATREFGHFAMYEPPSNGLAGMGENYIEENYDLTP